MNNKKIMFLSCPNEGRDINTYRKLYNIDSFCVVKKKSFLTKIFLFLGYYFYSPLLYFTYGDWKHIYSKYDVIILDTRRPSKYALKMLTRKNKRVITFYWNSISNKELSPKFIKKYTSEIATFDMKDAEKYDIKFNDTCIYDKVLDNYEITNENFAYYLGVNKNGRLELLEKLENMLLKNDIQCDFNLVGSNGSKYDCSPVNYVDYLSRISKSKVIIEIVSNGQSGLTLRTIEAMYYGKKLITNNKSIVNYDFYNKSWIYILDFDNDLKSFLMSKIEKTDVDIVRHYCFKEWIKRLIGEDVE